MIGAVLVKNQTSSFQTASLTHYRDLAPAPARTRWRRFAPDARVADMALLDSYQASIVDGVKGGMFRLQFGNKAMGKDEVDRLMSRLQREKIVGIRGPGASSVTAAVPRNPRPPWSMIVRICLCERGGGRWR